MENHRKFLKTLEEYTFGNYFPDSLELKIDGEILITEGISHTEYGSLIFLGGTNCEACDFDIINEFYQKYSRFNFLMLLYTPSQQHMTHTTKLEIPTKICSIKNVSKQLNYNGIIPWVFVINSMGQIIAGGLFNDMETLEAIAWPLIRVHYLEGVK
ncbi:hypothetical protein [Rossellomorea arthrocnemi]|uniref:hypothetical protein n=1 Tax=Rossellomorea arthrocnemi TaxID=2769542 RepID=UPI00191AA278|nr:hypothetical protein [Rossellomorea arthrocnemi]